MKNLAPKYNHKEVELNKYDTWVKEGYFTAGDLSKEPFCVVIPPPNVTGKLHLGHAWDTTLQDIITRYKRLQGFDVLYLPGMDHAGIATQAKVAERLRLQGTPIRELGRTGFLKQAWEWKDEYAKFIRAQWAKMGLGLDYSRERFTLDKGLNEAVNEVFVKLYEQKLIYRGERIINWDPKAQTALSNIEVIHKEVEGAFYHFKYMLEGSDTEFLEVATTRPETMFGDTAVAVHPKDDRYAHFVGKNVLIPGSGKAIPVITDDYVDREFGTGAVKITPAHDPNDFEVGNRHNLERPICMHPNGKMNELAGKYDGMKRFDCRKQLVEDLKNSGLVVKIETHIHQVGHSERTDVVVEPYLSKQWFVDMKSLANNALENQKDKDNKVNFVPERFEKTYTNWMTNIHDWCISRQLWWGHQIPAWHHDETGEIYVGEVAPSGSGWTQDEDVLDTWFSSALWAFSTLDWLNDNSSDFKRYFPTNVLVTGYDIIFFWVSRMIFQSLHFTGKRPFKDVLIHGLIRDEQGRKMSKSLGNGIDPMDVIDEYGTDSLRYFLATNSSPGQDTRYVPEKLASSWNFINKLWNASRFVIMNFDGISLDKSIKDVNLDNVDKWILSKLNKTIKSATANFEKYEFGEATKSLYNFTWSDYCSWYIELSKNVLNGENATAKADKLVVLKYVLEQIVKMLSPLVPFVTEEIYMMLNGQSQSVNKASWPTLLDIKGLELGENVIAKLIETVVQVRQVRADYNHALSKPINVHIEVLNEKDVADFELIASHIKQLVNIEKLDIETSAVTTSDVATKVTNDAKVSVLLEGLVDYSAEKDRLETELKKLEGEVKRSKGMLSNQNFVAKAPASKVDAEKAKLKNYEEQYANVRAELEKLVAKM